ncbi:MAG: LPS export ABC transporter periplasmic protein LptC [Spirochaetales bacterium]|nr:LPS export ABC transporter periplasmic protein LptC [Spirochaetales bacterium]
MKRFFFFFLTIIITSCSLEEVKEQEESSVDVPKTVLVNAKITSVKKGRVFYTAEVEKAMTYDERNYSEVHKIIFKQYDKDGKVSAEGQADTAKVQTKSNNAELFDNISIYAREEETSIEAEYLNWENEKKWLTSNRNDNLRPYKDQDLVVVKKDDGTIISGRGFKADLNEKVVDFSNGVEGIIVAEKGDSDE